MIGRNLGMHATLVAFGVLDPFTPSQRRIMEMCIELRRAGIHPKDVQAYAVDKPVAWASVAATVLDEHTQRCRTIPGYQESAPIRLRRYKVACRARSLLSFAAAVLWARLKTARDDFMSPSVLRFWRYETGASWARAEALVFQPASHFEGLLRDAQVRRVDSLLKPRPVSSLLEVNGRRGPGRQLRDERERVGEHLLPMLGNRIPRPRIDLAAAIASEAMKSLACAPKPAKEPRDRSAKRPEQSNARRARSAKKARRGW